MSDPHPHTNRLIHESSPYLRQHAHNPVDWYAWGDDAFAAAKRDGKPILLSIGYSACHWCHVMERESFEDEDTARVMNEHFVNIKVDREERPDVDHIYMTAVQMLTGHGGWPLTVFLTPDGKPFYGGTYFPPEDRHGLPAFRRLLLGLSQAYRDKPGEVEETVSQIMTGLVRAEGTSAAGEISASLVTDAANTLARAYDDTYGGLGRAPKFPNEAVFELFLRTHHATGDERWLEMVLHTLRQMARGGVYDQLGGGFHRYSVDERWLVPHFEKMLYDNAQLVPLYLSAYQITGDRFFADIAAEVLDYVEREMRDAHGGFYSTQDADSEGEEGKFFVWTPAEVTQLVGEDDAEIVCRYWDITDVGNFEHHNILHVTLELDKLARFYRRDVEEVRQVIAGANAKMFAAREQRVKPGRDDKILTAWNGLMISAFAKGAEILGEPRYRATAVAAVAFVEQTLQPGDRLLSTFKDGVAKLNGYLDDYAFFAAALLDVFELVQDRSYLERARKISDTMITHFWDQEAGGFFFTSDDHEVLITRSKPAFDGSIPSGSSVAARTLLRLHHYTEQESYRQRAETILGMYTGQMKEQPFGFANLLCAVDLYTRGPREIAVVGNLAAAKPLLERIRRTYVPNRTLLVTDPANPAPMPSLLAGKTAVGGQPTVYVCHNMTCSAPVTTWETLEPLLGGTGAA